MLKSFLLIILLASSAQATIYYSSPAGSGSTCSFAAPCTLVTGKNKLTPGDTLQLRAGTYVGSANLGAIPSGTSWSNPVTVMAYPGEVATITPTSGEIALYFNNGNHYIIIDGLVINAAGGGNGIKVMQGSHHIRIQNTEVKNAPVSGIQVAEDSGTTGNEFINLSVHNNGFSGQFDHGFYISNADNLIDGCDIYDNSGYGIHVFSGANTNNNIIRNNRIHGQTGKAGILLSIGTNNKVYNNVIYGNAYGVALFYGGSNAGVYNNTLYGNQVGLYICCGTGTATASNNITYNNNTGIYIEDATVGVITLRNNLSSANSSSNYTSNSGSVVLSGNLFGSYNPQFVNAAANNFDIQSTSAAKDVGLDLSAQGYSTDIVGTNRPFGPAWDIGAYEYIPTWYVRTNGGNASQCTGIVDAAYPGSGTGQPCAFNTIPLAVTASTCEGVIRVQAGQTFDASTPIVLSNKSCSAGITIQSSVAQLLPAGRVSSANTSLMPTVRQTGINGAFVDVSGGSYWILDGLQVTDNLSQDSGYFFDLRNGGKTKITRSYVHPKESNPNWNRAVYRGIWYEGTAGLEVTRSDFRGFLGYDSGGSFLEPSVVLLSIAGVNVTLTNNFLSAWYGTIFTGGGSNFSGDVQATLSGTPTTTSATVSTTTGLTVGKYVRVDFRGTGIKSGSTFTRTSGDVLTQADVTQPYGLPLAFVAQGYVFHVTNMSGNAYTIAESFFPSLPDGTYNWQAYEAVAIDTIVGNNLTYHGVGSQAIVATPTTNTRFSWTTSGATGNASNWTIQQNNIWKDPAFVEYLISIGYSLPQGKGVWEMKTMYGMTFNGNYITGYPNSIFMRMYDQDGSAPWATVANLILTNNYFKLDYAGSAVSGAAYSINLSDPYFTATPGTNILISNNLIVNGWESLLFWEGGTDATTEHNTIINNGSGPSYHSIITADAAMLSPSLWRFRDNIGDFRQYGAQCLAGGGQLSDCWPSGTWSKNVIVDSVNGGVTPSTWGVGSILSPVPTSFSQVGFVNSAAGDYTLSVSSPYKAQGTGGTDPGVNMVTLLANLGPQPSPTPAPSPTPTPTFGNTGKVTLGGKVVIQ